MKKKYCIVGAGGFGRETLACLTDCYLRTEYNIPDIAVFMDDNPALCSTEIMGIPVIGTSDFNPNLYKVVVAIGDPVTREKFIGKLPMETEYTKIIHPSCIISQWVKIEEGAIITAGTVIICNVEIGKHAHLNLNTTIGHDCKIGDYFTTAPATNISGSCEFGNKVYFGTNSSARENIHISDNVTIGMGGVVVKHIYEPGVYVGNPVKKLS
jgi:sugar O-acyltransferase (sialic acid O-acetyltransferase NeuD family)